MSMLSTDFDWSAPEPQIFTRSNGPCFWPSDRLSRPHTLAVRHARELKALTLALPPALTPILRERFKPTRGPLVWKEPPSLPLSMRQGYRPGVLADSAPHEVCWDVCITAGMIERLLTSEEGMVTGLTHNHLFAMQMLRLRQLWEEIERRAWGEDPLVVFERALG
jgi:hypothetical protein